MENVTTILSARHKKNFNEWQEVLEKLGYKNHVMTLDARNFGVPQMRERTYMLSVYCQKDRCKEKIVTDIFNAKNDKNLHKYYSRHKFYMKDVIKDDYSNFDYYKEALESNPNLTESRKQICTDYHH
jgi:DNA (cytosine-5)-methyltransferase 1